MTTRLTPYGSADHANAISKVGKSKTPHSLVALMPSADVAAKVGGDTSSPSPLDPSTQIRRVVRRKAQD